MLFVQEYLSISSAIDPTLGMQHAQHSQQCFWYKNNGKIDTYFRTDTVPLLTDRKITKFI